MSLMSFGLATNLRGSGRLSVSPSDFRLQTSIPTDEYQFITEAGGVGVGHNSIDIVASI